MHPVLGDDTFRGRKTILTHPPNSGAQAGGPRQTAADLEYSRMWHSMQHGGAGIAVAADPAAGYAWQQQAAFGGLHVTPVQRGLLDGRY